MYYNNYHKKRNTQNQALRILSVRNGELKINSLLQAELLGFCFGINKWSYVDDKQYVLTTSCRPFPRDEYGLNYVEYDYLEDYYQELAQLMQELGSLYMMAKCELKAHLLMYRRASIKRDLPYGDFRFVHPQLENLGYARAAQKLERYYKKAWNSLPYD